VSTASANVVVTDPRQRRNIMLVVCAALVAVISSISGLNVAQQQLAADLGASQSALLWIINGYTLALAALLMPVGAVGDRWGRKRVLLIGLVVFAAANVAGGLAGSTEQLLASRIVAGGAAAMIMPVTLSVITSSFPPEERGKAVGVWSGVAGAGGLLGMIGTSLLIDAVTWPWVFVPPVILAALAIGGGLRAIPDSRDVHEGRFDVVGSVLSAVAIGALVLGVHDGPQHGWTEPSTLAGLLGGALALGAFVWWELRNEHPLFDLRLFADPWLATGSAALLVVFAVLSGIFLVLVQFFQAVLGWSAMRATIGLLPLAVVVMPLSTMAPMLAARIGLRRVMLLGTAGFPVGLLVLARFSSLDGGYLSVLPGLLVVGMSMGIMMTPATTAITAALPANRQGVASALNDVVREFGGALGIAMLGAVLSGAYASQVAPATDGLTPEQADMVRGGIGTAYVAAEQMGADGQRVLEDARLAFVHGWHVSMAIGAAVVAVLFLFLLFRLPRTEPVVPASSPVAEPAGG